MKNGRFACRRPIFFCTAWRSRRHFSAESRRFSHFPSDLDIVHNPFGRKAAPRLRRAEPRRNNVLPRIARGKERRRGFFVLGGILRLFDGFCRFCAV